MKERHRLIDQIAGRYRSASREQKKRILDEFVATTGHHRKYAIHLLARWGKSQFVHFERLLLELKAGRRNTPAK